MLFSPTLKSLIDSDYYKNNNRLHWHVEHLEYDKFTKDLYTWLNSIELFAEEKEIFDENIRSSRKPGNQPKWSATLSGF